MTEYILWYLCIISIISVFFCIYDKWAAKKHKRRISEKTLFVLCFVGGSVAMYITMRLIHHKTLHKRFMMGIPLIIVLQCVAVYFLINCIDKV